MKKYLYLFSALTLATMVGCQNEDDILEVQKESNLEFSASLEDSNGTRTALTGSDNQVIWLQGDLLSVFGGSNVNQQYKLTDGANTTLGTFGPDVVSGGSESDGGSTASLSANAAYYPHNKNVTISENNGSFTFNAVFPVEQTFSESGTFGNGASPMVAVSTSTADATFMFKNVGSIFKLPLTGSATITHIKLEGTNGQKLAGNYSITTTNTEVDAASYSHSINADNGVSAITLDCGEGVQLSSSETVFVFAMLPVTFGANELKITIYDDAGKKMTYTHQNGFTLERSKSAIINAVPYAGDQDAITTEASLKAALNQATSSNDPVVVEDDITLDEPLSIESNQNVILDLNGNTLIFTASTSSMSSRAATENTYGLTNEGTLNITNGKIISSTDDYGVIYNSGTLNITNSTIETVNRGVVNDGTATLNCNIISTSSNAVCNYSAGSLTINGGNYESKLENGDEGGIAVRMGDNSTDYAWTLEITGGTFKAPYTALHLINNYSGLTPEGKATISGATFEGGIADIGGAAIKNITISKDCTLDVIKNLSKTPSAYSCEITGTVMCDLRDNNNHYGEIFAEDTKAALVSVFTNGGSVTLTENVTLDETLTVPAGKTVVLNLGDYTLTSTVAYSNDSKAIENNGNLTITSTEQGGIVTETRGIYNAAASETTLNCNITSNKSNAVCNYYASTLTIKGGIYESKLENNDQGGVAVRMGDNNKDYAWTLEITGGTFKAPYTALHLINNYSGLTPEGKATISGATFEGGVADIGGAAIRNITISKDCTLDVIKNLSTNPSAYDCKFTCGDVTYNLTDNGNHYSDIVK